MITLTLLVSAAGCGGSGGVPAPSYEGHVSRYSNDPGAAYLEMEASGIDVSGGSTALGQGTGPGNRGDQFARIEENGFVHVADQPLSTFSIDVDTASYSKTRRYLLDGSLPPVDAVRIEEFLNYFSYDYSSPSGEHPLAVHFEIADTPWKREHRLLKVALKAEAVSTAPEQSNLVFLVDVSGSMDYPQKLPLVKAGLRRLASQLRPNDSVAIVVYSGAAGLVLPPTRGDSIRTIHKALDRLHAGGSTNGGKGIQLAYRIARENFCEGGANRVILCTDGDFNVGTTSPSELIHLAASEAKHGIYLSVLGFGVGNHNDSLLEELSNKADGNYFFIDTLREAEKVLVEELDSTLVTVAKDVKIQIEFNPARVAAYRLLGYENRQLRAEEFNNDQVDAGEVGAGHSVTAFYEVISVDDVSDVSPQTDPLRYQTLPRLAPSARSSELGSAKVRYKLPGDSDSRMLVCHFLDDAVPFHKTSDDFRFAAAVASFGMLLRDSRHRGASSFSAVHKIARNARGEDRFGYREEFLQLVDVARRLRRE